MLSAEPLIFDSYKSTDTNETSPSYNWISSIWIPMGRGKRRSIYLGWILLSNTPIREVMMASPSNDKNIFIIEDYSKNRETSIKYE